MKPHYWSLSMCTDIMRTLNREEYYRITSWMRYVRRKTNEMIERGDVQVFGNVILLERKDGLVNNRK